MVQTPRPQIKRVIVLIIFSVLILLAGGLSYYFFKEKPVKEEPPLVYKEEPPSAYRVTVDLDRVFKLTPRPSFSRKPGYPGLNFYFTREAIDVSQYQRIEVLNPAKLGLRLLEELEEKGLLIVMGRRQMGPKQEEEAKYKELPVLEELSDTEGISGYFIEVEKLVKGKRYVLCEWDSWRPHPRRYFFIFTRQ